MNLHRKILSIVLITAAITYLLRALPLVLFRRQLENRFIAAFIDALPYALLAAMILPDIFYSMGEATFPGMPTTPAIAGAFTALTLGLARRSLPIVALASAAIAYLTAIFLV